MTDQTQNKFIYFPVYLSDYVSQSRKLTMLQRGALIDLSVLYFQENLKISYPKEHIYRMVFAFTSEEQLAIDCILENFFIKIENKPTGFCWVSNQLNEIASKVLKRLKASRENGKKGGRGNKKIGKPIGKPIAKPIGYNLLNLDKSILNEIKLNEIKLNKDKEIKENYIKLANSLIFVLEAKMNKKLPSACVKSYAEEIRKLIEIDLKIRTDGESDVINAIQSISENYGKDYFPIIQSGKSFREKFSKIENYNNKKQKPSGIAKPKFEDQNYYDQDGGWND